MVVPALWIQSHKPRGYWPIKLIGHNVVQVYCVFVASEQLRAAVSATNGCVVVISGACDLEVIAADALATQVVISALSCNFMQAPHCT